MINQRTILVIDDEPSIREMLTIFLEEMGYMVKTADTVKSGIAAVDTGAFDLAMCDLRLPDGTGLEVLDHARKNPTSPPVSIITAHTTPPTSKRIGRAPGRRHRIPFKTIQRRGPPADSEEYLGHRTL